MLVMSYGEQLVHVERRTLVLRRDGRQVRRVPGVVAEVGWTVEPVIPV